ncbi:hypothetical protein ACT89R_01700 [Rhodococcus qingshengii]
MAFATPDEVAGQWRPLNAVQQTRATALLDMAAIILRRHVPLDGLPYGDENLEIAKQVSIDMVIDALIPGEHRGKSSFSLGVGAEVESATLLNPSAKITFTADQRSLFGLCRGAEPRANFGDD